MVNPILVLLLIMLCTYCFYVQEIRRHTAIASNDDDYVGKPTAWNYINWSFFGLILTLTLWSHYKMVFSSPGYIPQGYQFRKAKMGAHDRFVYSYLLIALNSTFRQQMDGSDADVGSIRQTKMLPDLFKRDKHNRMISFGTHRDSLKTKESYDRPAKSPTAQRSFV